MSKIVPIFVCGVVASIFSFDVQAFPDSPAPVQIGAPDVVLVGIFVGSAFTAVLKAPACPTARRMLMWRPLL
jgi:hypothetical protein